MLKKSAGAHIDQAESFTDGFSLSRATRAWGSKQDHTGRSPWSTALKLNSKHACNIIGDISLASAHSIVIINEVIEGRPHSSGVKVVLVHRILCHPLDLFFAIDALERRQSLLQLRNRSLSFHVQKNESVRDDADLLKGEGL